MEIFSPPQPDSSRSDSSQSDPSESHKKNSFPSKTAFAILACVAMLTFWRVHIDDHKGFDPSVVGEAFRLRWPMPPPPILQNASANKSDKEETSPVFIADPKGLDPFFAQLWKLEQKKAAGVVTVLHYGDSPITADLITGDVRAQLQSRFGDAGRGYTLIAKPWAWYGHRGIEISDRGWKMRTGVGLMREGIYGLGGAAFEGGPGATSSFRLTESEQSAVIVEYMEKPGGGIFVVEADGKKVMEQTTNADAQKTACIRVELPRKAKVVSIHPQAGTVTLFGADFRNGAIGILYDSLGLNGATTTVLARVLQPELWKQEIEHANPALIIINYGSNESSFGSFVHKQYAAELRLAIQRARTAAPLAAILIMSPMDRGERSGLNEIETMQTIPEIVAIQRQIAAETHCAFFDTYDAMGGNGTMARWFTANPRLVTADLLHPTPQGATLVANLFVEQLELGYNRWKMQRGITTSNAPSAVASQFGAH
jgi:lysophospholipase L1-like esterase